MTSLPYSPLIEDGTKKISGPVSILLELLAAGGDLESNAPLSVVMAPRAVGSAGSTPQQQHLEALAAAAQKRSRMWNAPLDDMTGSFNTSGAIARRMMRNTDSSAQFQIIAKAK